MHSLFERLDRYLQAAGGRQVVSLPIFVSTLALSFVLHFVGSTDIESNSTLLRVIAVLGAHVGQTAVIAISYVLGARLLPAVCARRLVASSLPLAAFVRALLIQEILNANEKLPLVDTGFRLISGTVLMSVILFLFSIVIGLITEHARETSMLKADEETLRELLATTRGRASVESSESANQIKAELLALLGSNLDLSSQQLSAHLRTVVDDGVRPLITRILESASEQKLVPAHLPRSRFQWSSVLGSLTFHNATTIIPLVIGVLALIPWDIRYGNLEFALQSAGVKIVTMVLALIFARQLADRYLDFRPRKWNFIFIPLFMIALTIPYDIILLIWNPYGTGATMAIQAISFVTIVSSMYSVWGSVQMELDRVRNLRRVNNDSIRWQIAYLNGLTWATKRNLARQLHGAVQSEIISVLLRIAKNEQDGSSVEGDTSKLQKQLRERLESILDVETQAHDFRMVLAEIVETWSAIAKIDFAIDNQATQAVLSDPLAAETAIEIIREAVSNAIRHGQATEIEVRVSTISETDCILAQISSVGRRFEPSGREGLGTQQLRDCTVFYSVSDDDGHTVVRAAIPFRADTGEYITI